MNDKDQPLTVEIIDDQLVIRVGIDVVKWAAEHMDSNNPFNEQTENWERQWDVTDSVEFAKDVRRAMIDEEEDGTTPLILFLDAMCEAAIDAGGTGTEEAE